MEYLIKMLTKRMSVSPMARQTGDSNRQEDSDEQGSNADGTDKDDVPFVPATATTIRTRSKSAKRNKVRANIDDRFKAVSDSNRPTSSTSRIDPWISNYVLVFLKNRSSISNLDPKEGPMIEILNRGGPFWDYSKHFDNQDLEGWLLVSDGLHSIKVWLTKECRDEIWQQVTASMATPMYAFHNYSARQCGLLEKFSIKPIDCGSKNDTFPPACELLCHSFRYQPNMQYMVVSDPNKIQDINDFVEVKHAYQAYCKFRTNQSGRRWGNAKTVVDNPLLFDAILKVAEQKLEQNNKNGAKSGQTGGKDKPIAAVGQVHENPQRGDESDDDDGVSLMTIQDMLASPAAKKGEGPNSAQASSQPTARRSLSNRLAKAQDAKKSNDNADDETDYMGALPDSALLDIDSQPLSTQEGGQPMVQQQLEKENDDDADSVIEIGTKTATLRSSRKRNRNTTTTILHQRNGKRIKFRTKEDWPNLPVFAALCKQLNSNNDDDPSSNTQKVIDIPWIQQPRVSLKNNGLNQWLNKLGY